MEVKIEVNNLNYLVETGNTNISSHLSWLWSAGYSGLM